MNYNNYQKNNQYNQANFYFYFIFLILSLPLFYFIVQTLILYIINSLISMCVI